MVAHSLPSGWTTEDYLAFEEHSAVRHEFVHGHVYAMSGGTQVHSQLGGVALALLRSLARGGPCRVFTSDMKVRVSPEVYVYPDASVSCGPRDRQPRAQEIRCPILVVEVLCPSTMDYDLGDKFDLYRAGEDLRHCSQVKENRLMSRANRGQFCALRHPTALQRDPLALRQKRQPCHGNPDEPLDGTLPGGDVSRYAVLAVGEGSKPLKVGT